MKYILHRIKSNYQSLLLIFVIMGIFTYISTNSTVYMFLINILVGFTVVLILGYQYDKKSMDYYYSLPINKTKLFMYNQISGYIIIIVPVLFWYVISIMMGNVKLALFTHFAFVASITYTYFIFSLITSLSHNHIDTFFLMIFYYGVPFIGITNSIQFLKNNVLGFPLDQSHAEILIRMMTFYVEFSSNLNVTHIILYCVWYVVCIGLVLKLTYYFVKRRKVEYSGGNFPHPLIYTFIKVVVIWIYLITTNSYIGVNGSNIAINILRNNFYSILIGLILFIIFTIIQKRNIQVILIAAAKYLMVVTIYLVSMFGFSYLKNHYYETKIPTNILSAKVELRTRGISIINRHTNENLIEFKEKENIELIKKIHENRIKTAGRYYRLTESISISYKTGSMIPFMRRYQMEDIDQNIRKIYSSNEFREILNRVFDTNDKIKVYKKTQFSREFYREFDSEYLKVLILSRFLNLSEHFNHDTEYYMDIQGYRVTLYFGIE